MTLTVIEHGVFFFHVADDLIGGGQRPEGWDHDDSERKQHHIDRQSDIHEVRRLVSASLTDDLPGRTKFKS